MTSKEEVVTEIAAANRISLIMAIASSIADRSVAFSSSESRAR